VATASHSNYTRLAINKGDIQDDGDAGTVCTTTSTLHPPAIFNRATAETKQLAGGIKPTAGGDKEKRKASSRRKPLKHWTRIKRAPHLGAKKREKRVHQISNTKFLPMARRMPSHRLQCPLFPT